MGKGHRFFETFAVGLALACAVLASQPAYADSVTLSGPDVTLLQEGTSPSVTYTLTNSGSVNITISSNPFLAELIGVDGDTSDFATITGVSTSGLTSPCTAGETLSAGTSCELAVGLTTAIPPGSTDTDFGAQNALVIVGYTPQGSTFVLPAEALSLVTVKDPAPTAVPEPASVVLLGSSLLGVFGLLPRKLL
jgi:hypothetical protein